MATGKLGRRKPTNFDHVKKYPLRAIEAPTNVPVVFGINWYTNFDKPVKDGLLGSYWIGKGDLGTLRGGHCICAKPYGTRDKRGWWKFYDQGAEGACVGFGTARLATLNNGEEYNANWVYNEAKKLDEFPGTDYDGTSVDAGFKVLKTEGLPFAGASVPYLRSGITAYRWATSWDEVRATLGIPDSVSGVPLLNSWGSSYPHVVNLTDEAGERLLSEDGEFGIATDR